MTEIIKMKLHNDTIEIDFLPNSHTYKMNWEKLPSVSYIVGVIDKSQILKMRVAKVTREYLLNLCENKIFIWPTEVLNACNEYLQVQKWALDIGTQVHDWVENYTLGNILPFPENENVKNGILAFLKWKDENHVEFLEVEKVVYHKTYKYVGKLDAVAKVNWKIYILDYKTSKAFYPLEMSLQVKAYEMAYKSEKNDVHIDWGMILRFDKETGEFEVHNVFALGDKLSYVLQMGFLSALELRRTEKTVKEFYKVTKEEDVLA